jgi:hypothetical protein
MKNKNVDELNQFTLDAESQWRLAESFAAAVGGAAGVQSGPGMRDRAEDEAHVAKHHTGADVVHQTHALCSNSNNPND